MKKVLTIIALVLMFNTTVAFASNGLELGSIKPDSNFFFLQTWSEQIKSLFLSKEAKINYLIELNERRTAEVQYLSEKKADKALEKANQRLEKYSDKLDKTIEQSQKKAEVLEKIIQNKERQQQVLQDVYNKAPEAAQKGLKNAQENSAKQLERLKEKYSNQTR